MTICSPAYLYRWICLESLCRTAWTCRTMWLPQRQGCAEEVSAHGWHGELSTAGDMEGGTVTATPKALGSQLPYRLSINSALKHMINLSGDTIWMGPVGKMPTTTFTSVLCAATTALSEFSSTAALGFLIWKGNLAERSGLSPTGYPLENLLATDAQSRTELCRASPGAWCLNWALQHTEGTEVGKQEAWGR